MFAYVSPWEGSWQEKVVGFFVFYFYFFLISASQRVLPGKQ